ncbi:MAG: transporter [Bacteroidota bacterium]|jgi:hypothetical protein
MLKFSKKLFFTIVFLILNINLYSQVIITDRPDYTESPFSIKRGQFQFELGIGFQQSGEFKEVSYPNSLLRIGLGNNSEIRFGLPRFSSVLSNDLTMYFNDIVIELKHQLSNDESPFPFALLFVSSFPTGSREVTAKIVELGFKIAASHNLNEKLGLGLNVGAISINNNDARQIMSIASIAFGISLSNNFSTFVEAFTEKLPGTNWQTYCDLGITYLLNKSSQLDFYLGKELSSKEASLIIGCGFSFAFGI